MFWPLLALRCRFAWQAQGLLHLAKSAPKWLTAAGVSWRIVSALIKDKGQVELAESQTPICSVPVLVQKCGHVGGDRISVPMGLKALYGQEVNRRAMGENVLQCIASHLHCSQSCRKLLFDPIHARSSSWIMSRLVSRCSSAQVSQQGPTHALW